MENIVDGRGSTTATAEELVGRKFSTASKLQFTQVGGRDVYNITAPFQYRGKEVIAGRIEDRDREISELVLFYQNNQDWEPLFRDEAFMGLQDPCVTVIDGRLLLGGVRFPCDFEDGSSGWRMDFYHENSHGGFDFLFSGPPKMKDIRLLQLDDERILVLTRPQGAKGGRGRVGFYIADSLSEVTEEAIISAPLLEGLCGDEEWVGSNEAHLLSNGKIGVLGHTASFDEVGNRHYYAMAFCLELSSAEASAPVIIARRSDFPEGPAKRPDLHDVLFSGGLVRHPDGTASLYVGLSDAEAGVITLPDPFIPYE